MTNAKIMDMTHQGDKTDVTALVKYAHDIESERDRLREVNADLLAALKAVMEDTVDLDPHFCPDLLPETRAEIRAAITKAETSVMGD